MFDERPFKPNYDDSTASWHWHRESERTGITWDREGRIRRYGDGMEHTFVAPLPEPPMATFPSYDMLWWERASDLYLDDAHKPKEWVQ